MASAAKPPNKTAARLRRDIPALEPDLVVWQVGTNDALAGAQTADYEATLRGTLQFLKAQRVDVLLVGMQWTRKLASNEAYAQVREATARVARREGVGIVSRYDAMRQLADASGSEDLIGPDNLHMNDRGYRCMAEQVAVTLAHAVDADTVTSGHSESNRPAELPDQLFLHLLMNSLRGLPCRVWLSACLEHSSDFALRGLFMAGFAAWRAWSCSAAAPAAGAVGAAGVAGAWAQAAPEKASMETRAIDLVSFMA